MTEADITIPRESLQKAWETYLKENCGPHAFEAACLAMLEAWPGSEYVYRQPHRRAVSYSKPAIILPLTENSNERE